MSNLRSSSNSKPIFGLPRATVLLWWTQWLFPGGFLLHRTVQFAGHPGQVSLARIDVLLALAWIGASVWVLRRPKSNAWVGRWGRRVGLACCAAGVSLALAEAGARVSLYRSLFPSLGGPMQTLRQPHPTRGWALVPDGQARLSTLDYSVTVRTNSRGLHDIEHDLRPREGVFRIVVLGDSFMEAYQVELDECLPRRLQRRLSGRDVEVVNLGVGGYGTIQEYITLLEEGLAYEPDLVLLAFFAFNDVRNNERWLEGNLRARSVPTMRTFGRPYAVIEPDSGELRIEYPDFQEISSWVEQRRRTKVRYLADVSVVARLTENALERLGANQDRALPSHDPNIWLGAHILDFADQGDLSRAEYARHWEDGWSISLRSIGAIRDLAEEHGARFAAFLVPHVIEVDDDEYAEIRKRFPWIEFERSAPTARVLNYAHEHGISVLDLSPAFRNQYILGQGPYYYQREDNHWNPQGHALATGALIEFLDQHALLPAPPTR
jgi:hypothetical protein